MEEKELWGHTYKFVGGDRVEIWSQGSYYTKGVKRGEWDPASMVNVITVDEANKIFAAAARQNAENAAAADRKRTAAERYATYCAALPMTVAGFVRGHIGNPHEFEDEYGNFVCSVPKKASEEDWSVEALALWIDANLENFYE